ncbi:unnamed protein product [Prorocentrum cordatum]|uniref:Uncharacterized protein n=1 Tax=Prorocentrum cordatum TaxID=2364126 RepID=A0ABN9XA11_9DINO|nr:unnamed protein product [Polarella glacialis]
MDAALEEAVRASARVAASAGSSVVAEVRAATRELRDSPRRRRQVDDGHQRLREQLSGAGAEHQRLARQHGELSRQHGEVAAQLPELRQAVQGAVAGAAAASRALSQVSTECGQRIEELSRRVGALAQAEQQRQADAQDATLGLGERLEELDRRVRLLARDDGHDVKLTQQREAQIEELADFCRQRTAAVESKIDQVYKEFGQHFGGLEQSIARGARCERALEELGARAKQEASRSAQGVAELEAQVRHLQQSEKRRAEIGKLVQTSSGPAGRRRADVGGGVCEGARRVAEYQSSFDCISWLHYAVDL